jgi:sec-independent protein translocase protein TatB
MFGIGFSELVIIGLILIIMIKPEDLPKFFRSMGKFYGQLKRTYEDLVSVKDKILKEIDDTVTLEEKKSETAGKTAPAAGGNTPLLSEKPAEPPKPQTGTDSETPQKPEPKQEAPNLGASSE